MQANSATVVSKIKRYTWTVWKETTKNTCCSWDFKSWTHQLGTLIFEALHAPVFQPRRSQVSTPQSTRTCLWIKRNGFVMCLAEALHRFRGNASKLSSCLTTKSKRFTSVSSETKLTPRVGIRQQPSCLSSFSFALGSKFLCFVMCSAKTLQFLYGTAPFVYERTALWIIPFLHFLTFNLIVQHICFLPGAKILCTL